MRATPVVDLFAGPGGLGEGFAAFERSGSRPFHICVSVEKDGFAHQTLELRSFFRQFTRAAVPAQYYDYLRTPFPQRSGARRSLFEAFPDAAHAAHQEAMHVELGTDGVGPYVAARIAAVLKAARKGRWVLIGGPPCQVYSVMGRSRLRGSDPRAFEQDHRHRLYREYLRIIARFAPDVFVMENVKGILSATVDGECTFDRIRRDLADPGGALREATTGATYSIHSLVTPAGNCSPDDLKPTDFVIESERYGIPQARHRVILLGIRNDLGTIPRCLEQGQPRVSARDVLSDLPRVRSRLTREADSPQAWRSAVQFATTQPWYRYLSDIPVRDALGAAAASLGLLDCGGEFVAGRFQSAFGGDWYGDERLGGVCNHTSRAHMRKDLHRYLYAACFANVHGQSPKIADFPPDLWPKHDNVTKALDGSMFPDRFRVQLATRPATTITCHLAKDGHYGIHPDPTQCRSITVREAARLQTFPDNYFFEGPRTEQYRQVGNAVPPLLARQIAAVVYDLLEGADRVSLSSNRAGAAGEAAGIAEKGMLLTRAHPVTHSEASGHRLHRGLRG